MERTRYRDYATAQEICNSGIPGERYLKSIAALVAKRSGCTLPEVRVTEHYHAMMYEFEAVFDSRRWAGA